MNDQIRRPGFHSSEKQDSIRFYVLKKLSYPKRMVLYLLLIGVGFLLQVLTMKVWPGAILLIFATIVNMARSFDSISSHKSFANDSEWTQVEMEQIRKIEELNKKMSSWNKDFLVISNGRGISGFVLMVFVLFFAYGILSINMALGIIVKILVTDAVVLILPLWFSGISTTPKQENLSIKADFINKLEGFFQNIKKEGENFKPALILARSKDGECIPKDCRFSIAFDNKPVDFYGIQAQININSVEGRRYPYFYCVIAAKAGFGLEKYSGKIQAPQNITVEFEGDSKADVIVIRQYTTNTSGYHTKLNDCMNILDITVNAARMILEKSRV